MTNSYELVLIFVAVLVGVVSAAYFYTSTNIFINYMGRPLKTVGLGMFIISIGVLLSAFISFESARGVVINLWNIPLPIFFYVLYLFGSIFIAIGARGFTRRSRPIASAV